MRSASAAMCNRLPTGGHLAPRVVSRGDESAFSRQPPGILLVVIAQVADNAHEDMACPVTDHCPGCGSYLSLLGMGEVEVTGNSLVHLRLWEPST